MKTRSTTPVGTGKEDWHGTPGGYSNHDCGCEPCRKAHSADAYNQRMRRFERMKADPTVAPHGSASTYTNWGCHCKDGEFADVGCTTAWRQGTQKRNRDRASSAA